jgi:hypothetical protein
MAQIPTETEKRKVEQSTSRQISTQSNMKLVVEWVQSCRYCVELKEMVSITNVLNDFVSYGYSKELGERLEKIDEYLKNK